MPILLDRFKGGHASTETEAWSSEGLSWHSVLLSESTSHAPSSVSEPDGPSERLSRLSATPVSWSHTDQQPWTVYSSLSDSAVWANLIHEVSIVQFGLGSGKRRRKRASKLTCRHRIKDTDPICGETSFLLFSPCLSLWAWTRHCTTLGPIINKMYVCCKDVRRQHISKTSLNPLQDTCKILLSD